MADEPAPEPAHPVLYLTKTWLFTWEQHRPGGCRCVCAMYHQGSGTCTAAADPGRLLRVVTPGVEDHGHPADITDPLSVCAPCYTALAPLSTPPAAAAE
ncbi:DUF6372 family protein [Streptomyces antimycoticus]|uniref:DUF6372 family protein n=1 Tax=Streptomyces antimycoticus TaxID=68175 RepID=UPI003432636B